MSIAPPTLVEGAPRQPLPFGLFSVLTLRTSGDHWESGALWETGTCEPLDGVGDYDCDPAPPPEGPNGPQPLERGEVGPMSADPRDGGRTSATIGFPKDLHANAGTNGTGTPFTVYGHFTCSPVGYTPSQAQDRASTHLLTREQARVEQAFWTADLGNVPALQAATTTTLAASAAVAGLGLLEDWVATNYGSLGVIHLTRAAAVVLLAAYALDTTGGRLTTRLGTPVVAGAGYPGTGPAGEAPAAGKTWAFVTPAVFGYRSEVFTSSNTGGDLFDRGQNNLYAVAERTFLLGFDPCGVAAVLLTL